MMTDSAGKTMRWKAYFRIIRPLNLLIMACMLLLVRYGIFIPVFRQNGLEGLMPGWQFLLLILATLFIGAGGYVINDVLDIEIDRINKPMKQVIGKQITEVAGNRLHINLTAIGVVIGFVFSYLCNNIYLGILFVIIPTALFYYSFKYKYLPLIGNIVVGLLAAMVVLIYWLFEFYYLKSQPDLFIEASLSFPQLIRFVLSFALFAFMTTFIREIVKDAQDAEGDRRFGCRTLAVILGPVKIKYFVMVFILITAGTVAWFQWNLFMTGFTRMAYFMVITQLLLLGSVAISVTARDKAAWGRLSLVLKIVMVFGMISLIFTSF
jgi:4-hydroxybenzoate polyprenyltransferase